MGDEWSQQTSILRAESHLVKKTTRGKGDSGEGWMQHYFPNPGQWRDVALTLSDLILCGHKSLSLFCVSVLSIHV
jgi:hypothetical protein